MSSFCSSSSVNGTIKLSPLSLFRSLCLFSNFVLLSCSGVKKFTTKARK